MSHTLGLDYAPQMNASLLGAMEKCGKVLGLSLGDIELLGQCEDVALGFVKAFQAGDVSRFIAEVDWSVLDHKLLNRGAPLQTHTINVF